MPQKEKKEHTLTGDIDNLKSRKELRQTGQPSAETWSRRFWAWLIDNIVVGVAIAIIFPAAVAAPLIDAYRISAGLAIVVLYWSFFDSNGRQSFGKKVMDLKLVDNQGNAPSFSKSLVNAFGKSLLLPIDVAIGALTQPGEKRRLFNVASDTFVVSAAE